MTKEIIYNDEGSSIHSEIYNIETFRDEVLRFLEYYTRSELLNIVIEAIEMHDSIEEK